MLSDLEWPSLQQRRKDLKLTLFYKAYYNHVDIDIPLQKNPRGMPHKFMLPSSRTNIHLHSFFPSTVRLWNVLPDAVVESDTPDQFKTALRQRQQLM